MELPERIAASVTEQLEGALGWLQRMVAINSFTANRVGVDQVGDVTAQCFASLGFQAERIPSINPTYGQHLVLTRPGTSGRRIGLVTHLDTVFPAEEEVRNNFSWRRVGSRIYGPGTMDIKGGTIMIYLILSALKKVAPDVFTDLTWVIFANSSEEVLSQDFGALCRERLGNDALAALVFESGSVKDSGLSVVTARKGRATFRLRSEGRGAHAGSRHERGANAIDQLAEAIVRVAALTDYQQHLTFNVGTVTGGTVVNRVPHLASAEVEMRSFSVEAYQHGMKAIMALNGLSTVVSGDQGHRARLSVEVESETPPWPDNPGTHQIFKIWQRAAQQFGTTLSAEKRGGISDGNFIWQTVPTMDGLGPYGDNAHCSEQSADGSKEQEYVDSSSFVPRATISTLGILELARDAGRKGGLSAAQSLGG